MTNHSQARQEDQGCVLLSLAEERRETKKSSWKDSTSLGSRGLGSGYNGGKEQNACGWSQRLRCWSRMRLRFAFYGLRMTRSTPDQVALQIRWGRWWLLVRSWWGMRGERGCKDLAMHSYVHFFKLKYIMHRVYLTINVFISLSLSGSNIHGRLEWCFLCQAKATWR